VDVRVANGDAQCNKIYCGGGPTPYEKDGKVKPINPEFVEWGDIPSQGQRGDLKRVRDEIVAGKSVDEIALEDPLMFHQYGRTLSRIEDILLRKKFRTEMTKGIWYWGATGVGKSHKAFEGFDPETHYLYQYQEFQDGYTGQETIIMNEFRGKFDSASS